MAGFLHALADRVIIFDGAAGTTLQRAGLGPDDFGGDSYEGCNEILNVTRPDVIASMHDEFLSEDAATILDIAARKGGKVTLEQIMLTTQWSQARVTIALNSLMTKKPS